MHPTLTDAIYRKFSNAPHSNRCYANFLLMFPAGEFAWLRRKQCSLLESTYNYVPGFDLQSGQVCKKL